MHSQLGGRNWKTCKMETLTRGIQLRDNPDRWCQTSSCRLFIMIDLLRDRWFRHRRWYHGNDSRHMWKISAKQVNGHYNGKKSKWDKWNNSSNTRRGSKRAEHQRLLRRDSTHRGNTTVVILYRQQRTLGETIIHWWFRKQIRAALIASNKSIFGTPFHSCRITGRAVTV